MKPAILIIAMVAAIGLGIVQHIRLSELNAETARLEAAGKSQPLKRDDLARTAAQTQPKSSAAQIETVREALIKALVAFTNRKARPEPAQMKQLLLAAQSFSGSDIARLLELLRADPLLADLEPHLITEACSGIFSESAPFAWRDYLNSNRDLPGWQQLFDDAVRQCLQADSKQAIEQFEKEAARGNPDFATTGIRSAVLMELATSDPDKMLAMAASPEFAADPDALAHLGGFVDDRFSRPEEHHQFLAALRRAAEKHPENPLWQTIRKDYVREMSGQLSQWAFEEMKLLVEGEMSREEMLLVAEKASHRSDLEDKARWADWFLGIDPVEWDRWIAGQPQKFAHPVIQMLGDWGRNDVAAASAWLETLPPGDLRSKAVLAHAWAIADREPDRAAAYLDELPESKGKQNLVGKIGKARQ